MAWRIRGTYYAPCSCKVGCPCALGEMEADQGWCSGCQVYNIQSGNIDGVDVTGAKIAWAADWPSGFLGGNGKGRLYFDSALSQQQRTALESLISGKRGGVFEAVAGLVPTFLPPREASINIRGGTDETRITVGDVADLVVRPLKGATGEPTRLLHGAATFRDDIGLAKGLGSRWRDPELRQWESLGHAEITEFDWNG